MVTGIVSVPFLDVDDACHRILKIFPDIPFWPQLVRRNHSPQRYGPFIKGQIVGPVTLAGSVKEPTGKSALYNREIMDTIVKGLAIKALT